MLEEKLIVGTKIKLGIEYCSDKEWLNPGDIITLINGYFEYDNGLYTETQTSPSVLDEKAGEFDSIYHLFGNDLEDFKDCVILDT